MPTVTQFYGNTTIDKEYRVLRMMDGFGLKLPPMSIRTYLDELSKTYQAETIPDFIVSSKKRAITIQGMFTVLNLPVRVVPLLDVPIPTEGDDIGAVLLLTDYVPYPKLKELIDRVPPIVSGYGLHITYIIIHDDD